ncbi:MAG: dehydrogenase [Candidatus Jettenia sp.]|uniref:Pyridine nucleotide-disulphide oxidoreductase n=1 Tax=Candidatus Jettenia caeni TaxID=247490 RepID=I3IK43_9BACT|nr:FAD-dependent oxidoreductase [Candidatus Jettenia sp. AMX1]MBC6929834.1 dehydrogenase [Candidatus Jettenia sp.]WKZ17347.1 MAG: FAD-dependent oxidoreductase [Candidatus Jettenia caeni]KAA0247737.1 MAG: dehydrogenase [Candidatus Jettenia sp. AMX1]MCE7882021.1 dehydrogenase [Candidatus Jettenia sp. AMX1]MCQ3927165.1 dehydrogenase [Candidatus Jettenia sp.]
MSNESKHLVIIGGVAAGMKAAAKARRELPMMNITVVTDEQYISYASCGTPYFIGNIVKDSKKLLIREPPYFKNMHNIDVLTRHQATSIDTKSKQVKVKGIEKGRDIIFNYDKLIIATGAQPIIPPLPGISLGNIFTLRTVSDAFKIKSCVESGKIKNAVIVGGGLIGLEMAENLVLRGIKVTIVELLDQILPPLDKDMALIVQKYLEEKGVGIITSDGVKSFEGNGDSAVTKVITGKRQLLADMVILSIGIRPNTKLAQEAGIEIGTTRAIKVNERMETNIPDVYAIGDCAENIHLVTGKPVWIALGSTAAKMGRVAAINATGGADTFKGVLGTLIVKVFELNVGKVGLSEREAIKEGFKIESTIVPASDMSHYYPGAKDIIIKLIADVTTRKLLGAEIVGDGIVDKRIDIIATALTFGAMVDQVSKLDLAYAPPYAMVMDAILVAANVLNNKLTGKATGILPQKVAEKSDRGEDFILLDVRTDMEYKSGHIKGCQYIPLDKLASRTHELDGSKEIITYCRSGLRAVQAYRILKNAGFKNVKYMDGSILAWAYGLEK